MFIRSDALLDREEPTGQNQVRKKKYIVLTKLFVLKPNHQRGESCGALLGYLLAFYLI